MKIITIIAMLLVSSQVFGCTCRNRTIESQIEKSDHIFISKVISKTDKTVLFNERGTLYKHKIQKVLKGDITGITFSFTQEDMNSCDAKPEMNVELVVFVSGKPPFRLGYCQYGGAKSKFDKLHPNWDSDINN